MVEAVLFLLLRVILFTRYICSHSAWRTQSGSRPHIQFWVWTPHGPEFAGPLPERLGRHSPSFRQPLPLWHDGRCEWCVVVVWMLAFMTLYYENSIVLLCFFHLT